MIFVFHTKLAYMIFFYAYVDLIMTGYFVFQSTALILLSIISTLAVALRMWARKIQRIRLISADYLIVVGLVRGNSPCFDVFRLSNQCGSGVYTGRCHLFPLLQLPVAGSGRTRPPGIASGVTGG